MKSTATMTDENRRFHSSDPLKAKMSKWGFFNNYRR